MAASYIVRAKQERRIEISDGEHGKMCITLSCRRWAAMANLTRWALVPISGIAVWYAVLLLGIAGYDVLDRLCPPELVVSGACTASWHGPAVEALMLLCTAIASAGIVVIPALVAPSKRLHVAALAFFCGAVFALYAASSGALWAPFVVAALTGSASLWFVGSKLRARGIGLSGRAHR